MTIEAIARDAGVSAQTVYAVFRSKRGILLELLNQARQGPEKEELVRQVLQTTDPLARLQLVARIACNTYESESTLLDLLRRCGSGRARNSFAGE